MSATVRVPTTLRTLTAGASEVTVDGATVGEVLSALEAQHPGFAERLLDDEGGLRRFVNVFVADDDVRFLEGLDTPVPDGGALDADLGLAAREGAEGGGHADGDAHGGDPRWVARWRSDRRQVTIVVNRPFTPTIPPADQVADGDRRR